MRPGPPARQDKRYEVGQTSTQQERGGPDRKKRILTEMRISDREIQHREEKVGNPHGLTTAATLQTPTDVSLNPSLHCYETTVLYREINL